MSGKSYTMREMKAIVDYLTEHRAYSEIRGRKMWMDYANSRLTSRTWQSLKETFLKRILPDITNPYYRLDLDQIHSFKRGADLTQKDKNKLEFHPVGEESSNKDAKDDYGQPSTSKCNKEENGTGEDTTCSKILHNRASTETLILENCYETAEDIQRDLEKSTDEEQENENPKSKSAAKSVRDFIVYTEPLAPMLQEVLDDFATDVSSDREPAMEIDEDYVAQERRSKSPVNIEQSQSILSPKEASSKDKTTSDCKEDNEDKECKHSIENQVTEHQAGTGKNAEEVHLSQLDDVMVLVDEALAKDLECELNTQKVENHDNIQNSNEISSAMTDTLLPNNQEGVEHTEDEHHAKFSPVNGEACNKRKHSNSVEIIESSKKVHMDSNKSISNTDSIIEKGEKETKSPSPIKPYSPDEKNKVESVTKKHNLTLNTNIRSGRRKSIEEIKPSHNEKIHEVNSDSSSSNITPSSSVVVNPCLKSVSLYDERFSSIKYSDSDLHVIEDDDKEKKAKQKKELPIITKQSSEQEVISSDSDDAPTSSRKPLARSSLKVQKDKKLASLFGFTNGGASKSRMLSGRKRTFSHRTHHYEDSESSEWTSASDGEFVSPPRGRRNRYSRKYLKPQSARVMSLEEEGGLFVMLGKKIYPLVKDGKIVKNYLTFLPESDPEEDDSFWKGKYVEERKRTAELKKIIKESKQNQVQSSEPEKSPGLNTAPIPYRQLQSSTSVNRETVKENALLSKRDSEPVLNHSPDRKMLKIKFSKFDQEVQLEGHWQHINPVLAQVVSMFNKEPAKSPDAGNCVELSSGVDTPISMAVDKGVQEKVNEIESNIFKEIKEKDEEDIKDESKEKQEINNPPEVPEEKQSNVTLRRKRGRPKKDDTLTLASPTKMTKDSIEPENKVTDAEKVKLQTVNETPSITPSRKTRTPRKLIDDATESLANVKKVITRKSTAVNEIENQNADDEEIFYKFPSPLPEKRGRKTKTNLSKNAKEISKKQ